MNKSDTNQTEDRDSDKRIPDLFLGSAQRLRFSRTGKLVRKKIKKQRETGDADAEKAIPDLFYAIEELKSGRSVSRGLFDQAKELAQSWHPEFGKSGNLLLVLLAALVVAQKRQIERLMRLKQLSDFTPPSQKLTSKQLYDLRRRDVPAVGNIEWEFGGVRPPGICDMNDSVSNCLKPPEPPTCLDQILGDHAVPMQRLVQLFGRDRHLLSTIPTDTIKRGRSTLYDYRTVTAIMDALLSEKKRKRRSSTRRRPQRDLWLSDPPPAPDWRPVNAFWKVRHYCRSLRGIVREPLQTRVLTGIEQRINSLSDSVPEHIKSAFLVVIRRHIGDSGKK